MNNEQKYKTPSKHETIADIVAEMREFADTDSQSMGRDVLRRRIQHFARRFEAAAKREREAGSEAAQICGEIGEMIGREAAGKDSLQVGNAAAMREALEALVGVIDKCDSGDPLWWHIGAKGVKPLKDARAALSAPPRNCDVGTVAEQNERFDKYCYDHRSHEICCGKCPIFGEPCCELAWSQMPYEEGDAK